MILEVIDGDAQDRQMPVEMTQTPQEIEDKVPIVPWEADHVCELSIFSSIIDQKKPNGIDQGAWNLVKRSILGNKQSEVIASLRSLEDVLTGIRISSNLIPTPESLVISSACAPRSS